MKSDKWWLKSVHWWLKYEILKSEITDPEFVLAVYKSIKAAFEVQLESGILDVISPPAEFYPNWTSLRQTLGDPLERVQWRSKQNLDYAFLMMYAQWRGTYYVQLEDDILTKANFLATMRDFALGNFDSFSWQFYTLDGVHSVWKSPKKSHSTLRATELHFEWTKVH